MYHEHFGLHYPPFKITPDTGLFFGGGRRGEVLEALIYAICNGEGIIKVVGEVGSGKTMLSRMLEVRLPDGVEIVYLANPSVAPGDVMHAIALEMGLAVDTGANRLRVMHELQTALLAKHADGRRVVCFVEEAQAMPLETLEEIRLLSNLETQRDKLLQIVLFGQPELDRNLDNRNIRQLRERIVHSFHLSPFDAEDVREYIGFRMQAAGYRGPEVFHPKAYREIANASEGLVRRINIAADKALLAAYADNTHTVTKQHALTAIRDSEFGRISGGWRVPLALAATVAILALVGFLRGPELVNWTTEKVAMVVESARSERPKPTAEPMEQAPAAESQVGTASSPTQMAAAPAAEASAPVQVAAESTLPPGGEPAPMDASITSSVPSESQAPMTNSMASASMSDAPTTAVSPSSVPAPQVPTSPAISAGTTKLVAVEAATTVLGAVASPVSDADLPAGPTATPGQADAEVANAVPVQISSSSSTSTQAVATAEVLRAPAGSPLESKPALSVAPDNKAGSPALSSSVEKAAIRTTKPVASLPIAKTEPVVAPRARQATRVPDSLISERLSATERWLSIQDGKRFSIQLMLTKESEWRSLEAFLANWAEQGQLERVYLYRTVRHGTSWYGVLFEGFQSLSGARTALSQLPPALKRHKPFVRNIRDINELS